MNDENKILLALRKRSETALKILYDHYAEKVYNTAISYVQNAEDAEEVLQDDFMNIYNTADKFQFNASVQSNRHLTG